MSTATKGCQVFEASDCMVAGMAVVHLLQTSRKKLSTEFRIHLYTRAAEWTGYSVDDITKMVKAVSTDEDITRA